MFKDILQNLMKEKNLNQRQLGKIANIPSTTISGWLNAGKLPDYNALIKLRMYFDVSADYLLGLEDDFGAIIQSESKVPKLEKNADEEYVLKTLRSLSARDKELFLGVVGNFDRPVSELKNNRKHKA